MVGDTIEIEVTPKNFGRIAAQTAKQAILQKIRQAERNIVYEEYRDRVNDIVSGTIRRFERSDIVVDLGRAEAILGAKERISTEIYQIGDQVRALVVSVQDNPSGPSIILSRSHPDFVRRLFELEVAEIGDKTVEIKGIAREAGFRSKIAVISRDSKVDPVGACVGMRGVRVKNIVRELSGEKIDIVRWSDDIKTYVANSLSPAKLSKVEIDPDKTRVIHVTTEADQLSLAIGKRGQNVRLSSKLLGWKIDVQKDEGNITFEEKVAKAVDSLAAIPGIGRANAEKLVQAGFLNIEGILAAEMTDLEATGEFDSATSKTIYEAAAAAQPIVQEPSEIVP
jgi:N utilization substance protein A